VLVSATGLEFAYSQAPQAMKGVVMSFWNLTTTIGNLWVLLANAAVRNESITGGIAGTGLSVTAFQMFFFAVFALVAGWRSACTPAATGPSTTTAPRAEDPMQYPVTLALIAVTALVSWLAFKDRRLADRLILWPPAISERREYWRLVSYGFLHADLPHLLFNMVTLFFFGQHIERMMVQLTGSALTYPLFTWPRWWFRSCPATCATRATAGTSAWAPPGRCRRCCSPSSCCRRGR
jgi:Uncharacterized membrane protein (homolog of Drosophila rhomboid)